MDSEHVSLRRIFLTWLPLAASWLFLSFEVPIVSAIIARMAQPEINLAAFGGVVEPLRLLLLSPTLMMLSASTALCKDHASYQRLWRFMNTVGAILTICHFLIAFTPLYYLITRNVLGVPEEIIAPARLGLMIMLPIPWSVGLRRFLQGVMIRYGHPAAVAIGTVLRLSTVLIISIGAYLLGISSGVIIGACALTSGMMVEAAYTYWRVQPILRLQIKSSVQATELSWRSILAFYIPLVLTSLLSISGRSINSAALSRMPEAISSLAAYPVSTGVMFILQSFGIAYNEVVISFLSYTDSRNHLHRFTLQLTLALLVGTLLFTATPLANWWLEGVTSLPGYLVPLTRVSLWLILPLPALSAIQSWFQGMIIYAQKTRGITESIFVYLLTLTAVNLLGIIWGRFPGIYVGSLALLLAFIAQILWLWFRSTSYLKPNAP
ncbi:MAG: hypothetical protein HPY45_10040 [Anaerolineae bacterium]|nr:hypothetical protein [Anaerolineae bacterium]